MRFVWFASMVTALLTIGVPIMSEGNGAKDIGLSAADTAAMHQVFGSTPAEPSTETAGAPPDDGSIDVEVEAPATTPEPVGKVIEIARVRAKLEQQAAHAEGILNEAIRRGQAIEAREREIEASRAALKQREELIAILDSGDPAEYFAKTGKDPREFLERLAQSGQPAAKQSSELQRLIARTEKLEKEIADRDAAAQRAREGQTAAQLEQERAEIRRRTDEGFVNLLMSTPDEYPHLTEAFSPNEVALHARRVLAEPVGTDRDGKPVSRSEAFKIRYGRYPDDATVASFLDGLEREKKESRATGGGWKKREESRAAATPRRTTSADRPTIGPRASARTRPIETDGRAHPTSLSQDEMDRQSIAILEQANKNRKDD